MQHDLTDEQREVISKVEKLLRLAGKTTSEAEAASATAKATELLAAYNLSTSAIGSGDVGKRSQETLESGGYEFEYDLFSRVADTNFCLFWRQKHWVPRESGNNHARTLALDPFYHTRIKRTKFQIVGRSVNVAATRTMYGYLRETIERLTREYLASDVSRSTFAASEAGDREKVVGLGAQLRSRRAYSFREGMAARIARTLWNKRQEAIKKEEDENETIRMAAEKAMAERGAALPASRSLTLSTLRDAERDANMDHLYGEGFTARQRMEQEKRARATRQAEEEYTRWAAAHPEEARKQEAVRLKEERRFSRQRRGVRSQKNVDEVAYSAGYIRGATVGIDPQAGGAAAPGIGRTAGLLK